MSWSFRIRHPVQAQQSTLGGSHLLRSFCEGIKTYVEIGYPY